MNSSDLLLCLFLLAQAEFIEVQDGWIVESPLDDVDGVDDRGFGRRFSWLGSSLLAARQGESPLSVAQFHVAIDHR